MSARWQRREFLRAALLQLGALPLASVLGCSDDGSAERTPDAGHHETNDDEPPPQTEVSPAIRGVVAGLDRETAIALYFENGSHALIAELGARYLLAVAPGFEDDKVRAALRSAISHLEQATSDLAAIDDLRATIEAEFRARSVVDLEGWTLAPTELALCALLAIAEQSPRDGDAGPVGSL